MAKYVEAALSIIVVILLVQALLPRFLERLIATTLTALFAGIIILVIGVGGWLLIRYFWDR
ncbi:hypothetical protein HYV84_04360 [Candidatus Woesearchaeota archaeon]|nr:hypothetical protein [Candidatus Woesearchaeota archaeon]